MKLEQRPWLAVMPWTQVAGFGPLPATVLPHWPTWQRRVLVAGRTLVFTPAPGAFVTVLVPDEPEAFAALAATFGMPEILAIRPEGGAWWHTPAPTDRSVHAHLRDWHGTLTSGPAARLTHRGGATGALAYHDQLHMQTLVRPLPGDPHIHV